MIDDIPVKAAHMKTKYLLIPLVAGAVAFSACKDNPSGKSSTSSQSESTQTEQNAVPDSNPDPIKPSASAEDRAAKLGFAKHLPKNIAQYDAIFNGRKAFERVINSDLGALILERMADMGMSLDNLKGNDAVETQIAIYSEEYFSAYGKGTAETYDQAVQFVNRLAYYGARFGVFMGDGFVREGEDFEPSGPKPFMEGPFKGAPAELVKIFSKLNMPSYYQGAKVSDEDTRELVAEQMEKIVSSLNFVEGACEAITIKRGDTEFSGYKISGEQLAEMIDDDTVEEMQAVFEIDDINAFKAALAKKNLVAVSGVIGDYVILFFGSSEDDFVIVDDVADSLCASENIVFLDPYLGKDILSVGLRDAEVIHTIGNVEAIGYRIFSSIARGFSSGLSEAGSLGDTQDLEALLDSLDSQGRKLASMFGGTDAGYVAFIEDGLKIESIGGSNMPAIDFDKSHSLAPLATGDGTFFFANWTSNESYNKKVMEYVDTLGETTYLLTKRIAALDINDRDFDDFKESLDMFDKSFRSDVLEIWKALREDMADGLGAETAIVMDVNGSLPKIPSVPSAVLKEGKMPRIAYVSTVSDRDKLKSSWTRLNTSAENILKTVSEMAGKEIPMQEPMSSEKNDLTTWFIPILFQNNDFVPSVSVSDDLFFASTSKKFSEGLAERFKQGGGESRKGAWLHVDFNLLHDYAEQWLDLVDKNADELIPSKSAREDFFENKSDIEALMKALRSVESLTVHTRQEGGRTRTSLHLKTH